MSARALNAQEYQKILRVLAQQGRTRDRLLVILACSTGLRVTELLTLTLGQVWDKRKRAVRPEVIVPGPWGKSRLIPFSAPVRAAIHAFLQETGTHYTGLALFPSQKSGRKPMNRSQAFRILVRAAEDSGLDATRISTHSPRKTFVDRVYRVTGHDLIATQRIVGHSDPITTARYLEADAPELDLVVRAISA